MTSVSYLGHAGFDIEHAGRRLLIDPWFYPAFLGSWFPYPDNRHLIEQVRSRPVDHLFVSHAHEDHFDERLLRQLDRSTTVLVPAYRSKGMARRFRDLGFENVVTLGHRESMDIAGGFTVTAYLDTSHKEDAGILVDLDGFRFLDLNDCNTPMSEIPGEIDILAAQFSGAMWYPNCYDYPPQVMQQKVRDVRDDLMDTLHRKVALTGARWYVPSAGPACFLAPDLAPYNDRDSTIFPIWEDVADVFAAACPNVEVLRMAPGDRLDIKVGNRSVSLVEEPGRRLAEDLDAYRERRRDEWEPFEENDAAPVSAAELEAYFGRLQRFNKRFLGDFSKDIRLISGTEQFGVRLGKMAERFVIDGEEPYDPEYTLLVSPGVLRAVIDGHTGWEEALLSMRVGLHREPDTFDLTFMSLLRYGNHPVQTMQMLRERNNTETIERDGVRMQRFCPHAGEDLSFADIRNGVVECPRHHWMWDAWTGRCIDKGTVDLRVEVLDPGAPALQKADLTMPGRPSGAGNPPAAG